LKQRERDAEVRRTNPRKEQNVMGIFLDWSGTNTKRGRREVAKQQAKENAKAMKKVLKKQGKADAKAAEKLAKKAAR
jgi:hypothetical protein